jgi:hypothetical protein
MVHTSPAEFSLHTPTFMALPDDLWEAILESSDTETRIASGCAFGKFS